MADQNQALADLPVWLLILVAVAGLVGEMRQADLPNVALGEIVRRVLLRFGSSALFGMATLLLSLFIWHDPYVSGALGILVGLLGADIAGALYTRWLAKQAGVCDVPSRSDRDGEDR